jgi:MATE family multidrug resistance protein
MQSPLIARQSFARRHHVAKIIKRLLHQAWPVTCASLLNYALNVCTQVALGHLSAEELAGGSLGVTIYNITGLSVFMGLLSAQDTLSSQAFGAENFPRVGVILQRAVLILSMFCIPVAAVWCFIDRLLVLIGQPPDAAHLAGRYLRISIASIPAVILYECLKRFLQSQRVMHPMLWCSIVTAGLHPLWLWVLMYRLGLGFDGAPLANIISVYTNFVLLLLIACIGRPFFATSWPGPSREALTGWKEFLKLGIPGAAMMVTTNNIIHVSAFLFWDGVKRARLTNFLFFIFYFSLNHLYSSVHGMVDL